MILAFVPVAADAVAKDDFVGFTENADRAGVSNTLEGGFAGVRRGTGDEDGGKIERDCADDGARSPRHQGQRATCDEQRCYLCDVP